MAQGLGDLLSAVVAASRRSAIERERQAGRPALERAAVVRAPRGAAFVDSLSRDGIRVIAECKRRSPSRGVLRAAYDPVAIAAGYASAGAAAISVLTEPTFFDGSLDHLSAVRQAVDVPVLCKDFLVTEAQLLEARAAGADAVLLIVAALEAAELANLSRLAETLGLAALVEVHDREELQRALDAGATVIGVNSRNLRTLEVSGAVFDELAALIPKSVIVVAESGLKSATDLARLKALRYNAFLIGERFMTETDPGRALRSVREAAEREVTA
jgi:indole-3-glycerol phosphate synthase